MLFDVLLDHGQGRPAARSHKVAPAPEHGFAVHAVQVCFEVAPQQSARDRLEHIGQRCRRRLRVELEQQMNMVAFAVYLNHAPPSAHQLRNDLIEALEHGRGEASAPKLRHKDEVITKRVGAVTQIIAGSGRARTMISPAATLGLSGRKRANSAESSLRALPQLERSLVGRNRPTTLTEVYRLL